jgi:hypothetical protein
MDGKNELPRSLPPFTGPQARASGRASGCSIGGSGPANDSAALSRRDVHGDIAFVAGVNSGRRTRTKIQQMQMPAQAGLSVPNGF